MTSNAPGGDRLLSRLQSADGIGVVRVEDRFDTNIEDLWSALTEPSQLAGWLGEIEGELRPGGTFRARLTSQWEGTGRIDTCEPPRRLRVVTKHVRQTDEHPIEVTLTTDGDGTILVIEERGMPVEHLPDYGAGWQVQLEDLAAYLAGREQRDMEARWDELVPAYQALAASVS
jgi:uncharacterized protein YndB with AHSA1/START domain